jgi:carbamoyl-phosphate synthase large subunit
MGGTGGGIAHTKAEFIEIVERGIDAPTNEVLTRKASPAGKSSR